MNQIPINILLVEDSPTDASLLHQVFVSSGQRKWKLQQVQKLSEAITICQQGIVDLMLLELNLQDSQNLDTITKLRSFIPNIPVVALTEADGEIARATLNQGAQDYLVKSYITTPLLVKTIYHNLERDKIIQQLKEAEAKVQEASKKVEELNQLKSKVISTVSHEFRTPLTIIHSCTELLELYEQDNLDRKKRKNIQRIQTSIAQMINLLNNMLLLGQADAGELEFNPTPLDVVEFCRGLIEDTKANIPNQKRINLTSCQEKITAILDRNLLEQILGNLLSNAIKYSPQGEAVELYISVQKGRVTFTVKDRGIGIPQKELDYIFSSFYRGSNVGNIQGTGLGLAILGKALELQGGEIQVDTELNKGTVFRVILPLLN